MFSQCTFSCSFTIDRLIISSNEVSQAISSMDNGKACELVWRF